MMPPCGKRSTSLAILVFANAVRVSSWNCSIEPQKFVIKNSSLVNEVAMNRGMQVTFPGNQIIAPRFSWFFNNTLLRNDVDCQQGRFNDSEVRGCQGASGSTFKLGDYPGWKPLSDSIWAAKTQTVDHHLGVSARKGLANLQFDDGPHVDLPIVVWTNPGMGSVSPSKSVFGLGPKSDLLQTFLNASLIPSAFMGLFFGSRSLNEPFDGELLIGGWDQSRVRKPFVNYTINAFPMSIGCPLRVKVNAVVLHNDRGTHRMLEEGQAVLACIDPLQNQLTFTDEMYRRWEDATEHPTYNATPPFTSQSYPDAKEHLIGSLYIELEGGYNTTISHTELESVERGQKLDSLGEYAPLNNGRIMASVGRGPTDYGTDFGMLLGGVFLASTYVFVDYESNKFGLAPAVLGTMKSNIKKQCSKDTKIPPALISTETNSTPSSNSTTKAASTGLSASDKIAIGVSIPAGVAGIATLLYMILQDRRKRKAQKQKEIREMQKLELEKCRDQSERRRNESLAKLTRILSDHAAASPGSARSPISAVYEPWGVGLSPSITGPEIEGIGGNTANGNST